MSTVTADRSHTDGPLAVSVSVQPEAPDPAKAAADLRRDLRPFMAENRKLTWWYLLSTLAVIGLCLAHAALGPHPLWRLAGGVGAGLVLVRAFILYHDYQHGSILRKSTAGKVVMTALGWLMLAPPRSWKRSHDFHHAHVGQREHSHVGAFPTWTPEEYRAASLGQRIHYRVTRNPITIMAAYITVFALSITVMPFLREPRKHWDSIGAIILHAAIITGALMLGGFAGLAFTLLIPMAVASVLGAWLFFVQHNYPGIEFYDGDEWNRHEAALGSSSYFHLGPVMRWITGNIGFHHVHHANHAVPFYRLPAAMAAIPALAPRCTVHLTPKAVYDSFRVALWDPKQRALVPLSAARAA